jgi:cbb3-type cytochrome oxidase subunit 3
MILEVAHMDWLDWFARPENTKPLGLVIFFVTFVAILFYVFGSRSRGKRLESYKNMPFLDDGEEDKDKQ